MNPTRLRLRGFRTYDQLDLDLPEGCVGVVGENGAGKSSLVTAIELALFGPESRSLAPYLNPDVDDLMVELEFTHGGEAYRVRRGYSGKGRGKSTLDLECLVAFPADSIAGRAQLKPWEPLTGATAADTQAAIEKLLGLTRETFRASAYLAQGDGAAWSEAAPRDRKRVLAEILGLDIWADLEALAHRDNRAAKLASDTLGYRLELLHEQAQDLEERERDVKALALEAFACDEDIADAVAYVARLETEAAALTALFHAHKDARATLDLATERLATQRRITMETNIARDKAASWRTELKWAEAQAHEYGNLAIIVADKEQGERDRVEAGRLQREAASVWERLGEETTRQQQVSDGIARKLTALDDEHATCDRCGQTLGDALEVAQASLRAELAASEADVADLLQRTSLAYKTLNDITIPEPVAGLDEERARLTEITDAPARVAALQAQLDAALSLIAGHDAPTFQAEIRRLEQEHLDATEILEALEPLDDTVDSGEPLVAAQNEVARLTAIRSGLRDQQAHATAARDQARNAQAQIVEHQTERERLQREIDLTTQLERAFGRDGVPAHIVETSAIPAIEQEASRILTELGGPVTQVELRTEKANKDGTLRDALDVICHTEAGDRDYTTLSGGERTRVNLALRIALARLLSHRRGADTRLLAIDEPDGLDDAGMTALASILRGLQTDFDRVLLVSHQPQLRDAFDQTITVTRENGRSEVLVT